jgi:hypothetical protein
VAQAICTAACAMSLPLSPRCAFKVLMLSCLGLRVREPILSWDFLRCHVQHTSG